MRGGANYKYGMGQSDHAYMETPQRYPLWCENASVMGKHMQVQGPYLDLGSCILSLVQTMLIGMVGKNKEPTPLSATPCPHGAQVL